MVMMFLPNVNLDRWIWIDWLEWNVWTWNFYLSQLLLRFTPALPNAPPSLLSVSLGSTAASTLSPLPPPSRNLVPSLRQPSLTLPPPPPPLSHTTNASTSRLTSTSSRPRNGSWLQPKPSSIYSQPLPPLLSPRRCRRTTPWALHLKSLSFSRRASIIRRRRWCWQIPFFFVKRCWQYLWMASSVDAGAWGGPLCRRSGLHDPPRRRWLWHHQIAASSTLSCIQIPRQGWFLAWSIRRSWLP
jgi:hypothetical protein